MATPPSTYLAPVTPVAATVPVAPVAAATPVTAGLSTALAATIPTGMAAAAGTIGALLAVSAAPAVLVATLVRVAIAKKVAEIVVRLAGRPAGLLGRQKDFGPAQQAERRAQLAYRAAFILASAWRLQTAYQTDGELGLRQQLRAEHRYFAVHIAALRHRATAAQQVDTARNHWGPILGWRAEMDARTTPECRAANGCRFTITPPPIIGLPGTVHAKCRCYATKDPGPGAPWVDDEVIALAALGHP